MCDTESTDSVGGVSTLGGFGCVAVLPENAVNVVRVELSIVNVSGGRLSIGKNEGSLAA